MQPAQLRATLPLALEVKQLKPSSTGSAKSIQTMFVMNHYFEISIITPLGYNIATLEHSVGEWQG